VPVAATVESALALMVGRLSAEKIVLEWQPPPLGLTMWGDEVRLQQVLINLFRNALDAMRCVSSRCLAVEVSSDETTVSISVHDSGPGINSETMGQLFDPFFTTKPAGEGLGLGLSISERIVRSFGGHLVAANHPAGGAVFTVTLPRRGRQ
jgi:two-component system C4-dicarboxylate transport sensor histidine kinase DctB